MAGDVADDLSAVAVTALPPTLQVWCSECQCETIIGATGRCPWCDRRLMGEDEVQIAFAARLAGAAPRLAIAPPPEPAPDVPQCRRCGERPAAPRWLKARGVFHHLCVECGEQQRVVFSETMRRSAREREERRRAGWAPRDLDEAVRAEQEERMGLVSDRPGYPAIDAPTVGEPGAYVPDGAAEAAALDLAAVGRRLDAARSARDALAPLRRQVDEADEAYRAARDDWLAATERLHTLAEHA